MSNLVTANWLHQHKKDVKIIDVRFHLMDAAQGKKDYEAGHIPGAIFLDTNEHLSAPVEAHGGRHPLPNLEKFAATLGEFGITPVTKVVIYDDQASMFASRLWWLLKYIGHDEAYVLNQGFSGWAALYEVTTDIPTVEPVGSYPIQLNDKFSVASYEDVKQTLTAPGTVLIDSREPFRYLGEAEPIDKKAGHIPGAQNIFWKSHFNDNQTVKTTAEITETFAHLAKDDEIIVYCGSGISACPNVLLLNELQYKNVRLYAGSWSDWISYEDSPIAVGEEKVEIK
jgi:thiosulfate/3-mercaptopyruvate sulfurtransferase